MFLFVEALFFYYLFCGREEARGEKGRDKRVDYDIITKVTLYSSSTGVILNGQCFLLSYSSHEQERISTFSENNETLSRALKYSNNQYLISNKGPIGGSIDGVTINTEDFSLFLRSV